MVAEEAFKEKNLQHAPDEYLAGLDIYPTWPEVQFNAALILGELQRYPEAIAHMKMYLELTPDAKNATDARKQIWIWDDKVKSGGQ